MSTLAELPVGGGGRVEHVAGHDALASRLLEMGITPGTELRVMGVALMRDPIEVEVRGYRLSLRRQEAERVVLAGQ